MIVVREILVKSPGRPVRRIVLVRHTNDRRKRLAFRMREMGFPMWSIRCATRFTEAGLAKLFGKAASAPVLDIRKGSIWGDYADCLRAELARASA